jgi:hypothetical protein
VVFLNIRIFVMLLLTLSATAAVVVTIASNPSLTALTDKVFAVTTYYGIINQRILGDPVAGGGGVPG